VSHDIVKINLQDQIIITSKVIANMIELRAYVYPQGVTPGPIWMAHEWPMSAGARV
jgi:hypothetical protein